MQYELHQRIENLGDDFFQQLHAEIGDEVDEEGFTAADQFPLRVLSLVNNSEDVESSMNKRGYQTIKGHTPTRWHSILVMLESLGTHRVAINRTLYRMTYRHSITQSEWDLIFELINFLKIFRSAVEVFSADTKATLSSTLVFRTEIIQSLKIKERDHEIIAELKKNIAENVDKRFPITDELLTASILDPRLSNLEIVEKELQKREISKFDFLKAQLIEIFPFGDTQSPTLQPDNSTSTTQKTKKKTPSLLTSLIQKHAYDSKKSSDASHFTKDIDEEIHKYFLTVIPLDGVEHFNLLQFWKDHNNSLPKLARL